MTVEKAEAFIATARTDQPSHIKIAKRQSAGSLGGEAAMAQALLTWAAAPSARTIQMEPGTDIQDRDLISLIALALPLQILGKDEEPISPTKALGYVSASLSALDRPLSATTLPSGPRLSLLCADHLSRGHPSALYDLAPGQPPSPSERKFDSLASLIHNRLLQGEMLPPDLLRTLAFCTFELFTNTHDHGRGGLREPREADVASAAPRISLRGITARKLSLGERDIERVAGGSVPFDAYLKRAMADRGRRANRWFMEISVFDSGPGYASRLMNAPIEELSEDEERDAVRRCFMKHVGSKNRSGKGMGLADTRDQISKARGFFRLRTGRMSVCAALDVPAEQDNPMAQLVDWGTGEVTFSTGAAVVGTLFTLILPLMEAHENDVQLPF